MITDKLIFTPLDMPEPPKVDQQKLMEYCDLWRKQCYFERRYNYVNQINEYPWEHPVQPFRPKIDITPQELELREIFKTEFRELTSYVTRAFPFQLGSMTILIQKTDAEVVGHTDGEDEWAFRFYLWNNFQDDALWFRLPKDPNKKIIPNTLTDNYLEYQDPRYVKFPKKEYLPWAFNSFKSIHGVHKGTTENPSRCAVIVRGKMDHAKMQDLLERSVIKYSDYAYIT
jgi:hypothetical protein